MSPLKTVAPLVAMLCAAVPFAAAAQEGGEDAPFSWSVVAVSDYVWRGTSQTDEDPTVQLNLGYALPGGLYVGGFASGVDFGGGKPDLEIDYFVGYGFDATDAVNLDLALNRYTYPDAGDLDFNELIATATLSERHRLTLAYSNDFGGSETDAWYASAGTSWALPHDVSLDASVGYSRFDDAYGENYVDWSIGVSRRWGLFNASLGYVGTDGKGQDAFGPVADSRVVLTLAIGN